MNPPSILPVEMASHDIFAAASHDPILKALISYDATVTPLTFCWTGQIAGGDLCRASGSGSPNLAAQIALSVYGRDSNTLTTKLILESVCDFLFWTATIAGVFVAKTGSHGSWRIDNRLLCTTSDGAMIARNRTPLNAGAGTAAFQLTAAIARAAMADQTVFDQSNGMCSMPRPARQRRWLVPGASWPLVKNGPQPEPNRVTVCASMCPKQGVSA